MYVYIVWAFDVSRSRAPVVNAIAYAVCVELRARGFSLQKRAFGRRRDDAARCVACRGGFGQCSESGPLNAVHS